MFINLPGADNVDVITSSSFEEKVKQLAHLPQTRAIRACDATTYTLFSSGFTAILSLIVLVVAVLLLLGVIKGILGLFCCPPIGMCGLGALIDLPQSLEMYQEEELRDFPVKYDLIGWPVHPQTDRRTVRAISLRSEFCLNVIFFLTYPLVMLLTLLSMCCFARVSDNEEVQNHTFRRDHTILLTECPSAICKKTTDFQIKTYPEAGETYRDDSGTEELDTRYVLQQMQQSENSLKFNQA